MSYPIFQSLDEAAKTFKRCRTIKWYIIHNDSISNCTQSCIVCHKKLCESPPKHPDIVPGTGYFGNRCVYSPKTKKHVVAHYICSWEALLEKLHE